MDTSERSFFKALGPGLLWAGAAIGVSHLVQSTRAGAVYGLSLVGFVLLANLFKYPAFSFGPRYAAATGTSLLEGYRRQGTWALVIFGLLTVSTMFVVQAAISVVTAGLANVTFGLDHDPVALAGVLMVLAAALVGGGGYRWLDRIMKITVAVLTVSTLAATVLAVGQMDWAAARLWPAAEELNPTTYFFIAALVGWMPSAIDISVWHSLWTLARREDSGHVPTVRESLIDFNVGYLGTVLLALCFLLLGASVMHGSGATFANSAGGFAAQVIALYTETLGGWSGPVISVCAFTVMLSTTLTVVDGFPRVLSGLWDRFHGAEAPGSGGMGGRRAYWVSLVIIALGAMLILRFYIAGLKGLVDLATTLSFMTGPVLALLNHRVMFDPSVPEHGRPGRRMWAFSVAGVAFLTLLAIGWLVVRFGL